MIDINLPVFVTMLLVKATAVLALGSLAVLIARRTDASVRHAIWAFTLTAALTLPLGMIATPAWRVPLLPKQVQVTASNPEPAVPAEVTTTTIGSSSSRVEHKSVAAANAGEGEVTASSPITTVRAMKWSASELIPLIWIVGAMSVLLWMAVGRFALRRIVDRARELRSGDWATLLTNEAINAGVTKRVHLYSTNAVSTPLTFGVIAPVILVPADSKTWSEEHREVVIRHEMAHIARGDMLIQTIALIACAVYWFNPLVWIAVRGLRSEQERACDDRVLVAGTPPVDYAAHLLEVARSAQRLGPQSLVSLAMARPTQLEGRLLAVLNSSRRRRVHSRAARRVSMAGAGLTFIGLAAFTPISQVVPAVRVAAPSVIASQIFTSRPAALPENASKVVTNSEVLKRDSSFTKSVSASPGGTLDIDLDTGAGLTITSWDRDEIQVSGTLGGRDWRDTEVNLTRTSGGARLTTRIHSGNSSTSHHFNIRLPRNYNIRLESAGGGVSISDVDGTFRGHTGGGEIRIDRANGRADITTGGGTIRVSHSNLSGSVSTGGGTVVIEDVRGGLTGSSGSTSPIYINSDGSSSRSITSIVGGRKDRDDDTNITISGSGTNVSINERTGEVRDASGRVIFRKSGGRVNVAEALNGADIRTGGGSITIGRSAGAVIAHTGGGDITIGPLAGSAEAQTGAGDVRLDFRDVRSPSAEVTSGNGRVVITLPSNFAGTLDLETAYTNNLGHRTSIKSDWPLSVSESSYWDDSRGTPRRFVRARQTFGSGGGTISVSTVNGDIVIQRR